MSNKHRKTPQEAFGDRVRALRLEKKLSQEELAYRAKIHRNYLGGIERGERNPCLKNIIAIAAALDVSPAVLFSFDTKNQIGRNT